uniref:Peptidase M24 domain-containing protein n=1 Tax=Anopheles culicifacies TaxID=139723 RepID=A0A182M1T8_9DIPT
MYCGMWGLMSRPSSSTAAGALPAFRASSSSFALRQSSRDALRGSSSVASFVCNSIDKGRRDPELTILDEDLGAARVIKSPAEIEVLRYVARVSSDAHKAVMKFMKPGVHEYQAEAEFLRHSYAVGGCRHVSYTCICGAGTNSAILHYGHAGSPNDCAVQDGDMCLFDMGANYGGYAADITCSFPANGKFTEDQKLVYNAVLAARDAVCGAAREGVSWIDMHLLANRVMLEELRKGQLLQGDVDEMMEAGLNAIFQPHGLGHFLGLDVHDVGGYLPGCPERSTKAGVNRLRTARTLKAGMYLTIEPGCYFIEPLLNKAHSDPSLSKFLVKENLDRFRNFGGVRIEDDVLITKTGIENFTFVPRTISPVVDGGGSHERCAPSGDLEILIADGAPGKPGKHVLNGVASLHSPRPQLLMAATRNRYAQPGSRFIRFSSLRSAELDRTTALPMICFPDRVAAAAPLLPLFTIPPAVPSPPPDCITTVVNCLDVGSRNFIDVPPCWPDAFDVGEDRISPISSLGSTEVADAAASASASRWPVVEAAALLLLAPSSVFTMAPARLIMVPAGLVWDCDCCSPDVCSRVTKVLPSLSVTVVPSFTPDADNAPLLLSSASVLNVII